MNYRQDHPAWIYVRCASVNAAAAFDRLYDLIDEAAGHGFLVRGTSFDHCSGNTLKDRNGLRTMLDAVENNLVEAVIWNKSAATATCWWALLKSSAGAMSTLLPLNVT